MIQLKISLSKYGEIASES